MLVYKIGTSMAIFTEMSDILIMLLICVESDIIPLLHKLKSYIKAYLWVF